MPPPLLVAELPEMVELETVRVPELLKAPPLLPLLMNLAPETVTPDTKRLPPEATVKMLKLPLLPLILRLLAPRPVMVTTLPALMVSGVARVMV